MDVIKPKSKPKASLSSSRYFIPALVVIAVAISLLLISDFGKGPSVSVPRNSIVLANVSRGDLKVTIDGYGILRSRQQTLITAQTPATVEEIVLRPGATVTKGSVILRLSRPELMQELETSKLALKKEKANLKRLELSNRRELLREQSAKIDLEAEIEMATLLREAQYELMQQGIISALAYKQTELGERQKKQKLVILEQRFTQLEEELQTSLAIQQEQVKIVQAETDTIARQADLLIVKSGIDGVLQRLPVELGQSVTAGQELALVGSDKDLVALVKVPQSRAEQLKVGQEALIDTRRDKVKGKLTRITPQVEEGSIEVEIAFVEDIPSSARPESNVEAEIYAAEFKNALYIERPFGAQANVQGQLFKMTPNDTATQQAIRFGADAGRLIQLLDGALENEQFIISDMSNYRSEAEISVTN